MKCRCSVEMFYGKNNTNKKMNPFNYLKNIKWVNVDKKIKGLKSEWPIKTKD